LGSNKQPSRLSTIAITVSLSPTASRTVTVSYATSDGTATVHASRLGPSDYVPTRGTLTFKPGATTKTFTVQIRNDSVAEPNETILLSLSRPRNALLGTPSSAELTILDDDGTSSAKTGRIKSNRRDEMRSSAGVMAEVRGTSPTRSEFTVMIDALLERHELSYRTHRAQHT
jgi:hypothetical protein